MASQILNPFKTKHLWRSKDEGHASYTICATITDEPETWQVTEEHTLHSENQTKLVTARWVQGVRVIQKDSLSLNKYQ